MSTNLLHNTSLALREGDMATRLVGNELDLNLAALTSGLIIIIVIVVGSTWALALDTTILVVLRISVSNVGGILKYRWRRLLVLISDVGHGSDCIRATRVVVLNGDSSRCELTASVDVFNVEW